MATRKRLSSPTSPAKTSSALASVPFDADVPATCGMLASTRDEIFKRIDQSKEDLRGEIAEVKLELKIDIAQVNNELANVKTELKAEIAQVKTELREVKTDLLGVKLQLEAHIHDVKGQFLGIGARLDRMTFLMEEQNARNKVVLDAASAIMSRQDRVEQRMDQVEETVRSLVASRRG